MESKDEVYFNFINSIRADDTKRIYQYNINLFMKYSNVANFSELLKIGNPQAQIIKYLIYVREKDLSSNSISTRLNAIYHFYNINDVTVNKKKINL